jgi:hypothetical protein
MEQEKLTLNSPGRLPRLNKCLICGKWVLEKLMHPVKIPSQGVEYVTKLICSECFKKRGIDECSELE